MVGETPEIKNLRAVQNVGEAQGWGGMTPPLHERSHPDFANGGRNAGIEKILGLSRA